MSPSNEFFHDLGAEQERTADVCPSPKVPNDMLQHQHQHDDDDFNNCESTQSTVSMDSSNTSDAGKDLSEIPVTPPKSRADDDDTQQSSSMVSTDVIDETSDRVVESMDVYCMEVAPVETVATGRICTNLKEELNVGDHVYQWRSWLGIPGIFQHHGIVMDIQYENVANADTTQSSESRGGIVAKLTIADFSNVEHRTPKKKLPDPVEQQRRRLSGLSQEGILRTYTDTDRWHKVEYQAPFWKRSIYRAGTCTSITSDAVGLVLARVNYILRHPDVLPDYHVVNANCECVAVWCKTGRWSTLQASSFLELTAAGQVKSTATLAATAASAQVTVQTPAAGLWGWLGYTTATQVSWLTLHPMVIPALAGYAVLSVGVPTFMYVNARKQWRRTEERLKECFWEDAMTSPEVFAECITHWSGK